MAADFGVLGPLRAVIGGVEVTPRAPKVRSLLALLLVHHGEVVSADRITDELWPSLTVERARRVLWVRVAELRVLFKQADAASLLQLVTPGYRLAVPPDDVDVARFVALTSQGRALHRAGDPAAAARTLRDALALWRGEPLADAQGCLELEAEAARLADARLDAIEDHIEAELACGHHAELLGDLDRLVAEHPGRERFGRQLVVGLHLAGRRAEALAVCHQIRQRWSDELGLPPSDELVHLEQGLFGVDERAPESLLAPEARRPSTGGVSPVAAVAVGAGTGSSSEGRGPVQPGARRHGLPVPVTGFVGRAAELEALAGLLASSRLVTLTGVGGVGKTRLALEAAAAAAPRYPDGVCFVELAPLRDADAVPAAVIDTLGLMVDGRPPEAMPEVVAQHLATRRLLLVLDNAEHVAGRVADLVHLVLTSSPGITVLVTSREVLNVPGEATVAVAPLPLPPLSRSDLPATGSSDAVTLFWDRARAARPGIESTNGDIEAAAKICRLVDGIPLAIELAAARARMLGVQQIAGRLDDYFQLLAGEPTAGVPERQRTLRAALDWSHDLLAPAAQVALRNLAVFPGSFDLDAAIAVIEVTPPAPTAAGVDDGFTLLSRLVDKSLVEVIDTHGAVRYRLLEPIRRYAAEQLERSGEADPVRCRHRDVLLARLDVLWPLMTAQDRQRAHEDREDLRAALEWSWDRGDDIESLRLVALQEATWLWPGAAQGRAWLERVLARPEPAVHPARVRALSGLALNLHDAGSRDEARIAELLHTARALAGQVGDPGEAAACALTQVEIDVARGRTDEARAITAAALGTYERLDATAGVGWCHHALGWIAMAEDDHASARDHFEEALRLARLDAGGEWLLPHALAALAPLLAELGDPARAVQLADEAVTAARPFTVPAVLAMALARAAETAILAGDPSRAEAALAELLALLLALGTRRWAADALELAVVVLERRGDLGGAASALASSRALRAASGERGGGVRALAEEVGRSIDRLCRALGADRPAVRDGQGSARPPEVVMAEVLTALGGPPP